jgi:hypothetical protein
MKAIEFPEQNVTYAKNQEEYLNLPVYRTEEGRVTTCWQLTFWERIKMLFRGCFYLTMMTFNKPLQPLKMSMDFTEHHHKL